MAERYEKDCTVEMGKSKRESVERLFSLINSIFFMSEDEDLTLLQYLHEAKAKVLANNQYWSLLDYTSMIIGKVFKCIDTIDTETSWDYEKNKEWFSELKSAMNILKDLHPQWHLTKNDIDRQSTCLCRKCNTEETQKNTVLSDIDKLSI